MKHYILYIMLFCSLIACQDDENYSKVPINALQNQLGLFKGKMDCYISDMHVANEYQQVKLIVSETGLRFEMEALRVQDIGLGNIKFDDMEYQIVNNEYFSFEKIGNCKLNNIRQANVVIQGTVNGNLLDMEMSITSIKTPNITVKLNAEKKLVKENDSARIHSLFFDSPDVIIQPQINELYKTIRFYVTDDFVDTTAVVFFPKMVMDSGATSIHANEDSLLFEDRQSKILVWAEDSIHRSVYTVSYSKAKNKQFPMEIWECQPWTESVDERLTYLQPTEWQTNNAYILNKKKQGLYDINNPYLVVSTSEACEGEFAAKLVSNQVQDTIRGGVLFTGYYNLLNNSDKFNYHFGLPFFDEPIFISGKIRYKAGNQLFQYNQPINGKDSCCVEAVLFRVSGEDEFLTVEQLKDDERIIAHTKFTGADTNDEYVYFSSKFEYIKPYQFSHHYRLAIIIKSSKYYFESGIGAMDSQLLIDDFNVVSR